MEGLDSEFLLIEKPENSDLELSSKSLETVNSTRLSIDRILLAKQNFGNNVRTTPLEYSQRLSELYGAEIYLKREDLQPVRSYKIRGAYNLISSLSETEKQSGIVCASAGNHAQGVAITCKSLGIKGTIFMPKTTPRQKVERTKKFGGDYIDVVLFGDTFDEALESSREFEIKNGATFVHPFDDIKIIEGQATIGLEIFEQQQDIDYVICPVGGGGVVSGLISSALELSPNTKIIGVEPAGASSMKESLTAGENITLDRMEIFVDGASVRRVGELNFQIAREYGLEIITCPENRVCTTMIHYFNEDGIVLEPAGALSTDALKDLGERIKGKKVVVILSGGNIGLERFAEVSERSMKFEGKKKYFLVELYQRPGSLGDFLECLGPNDDITRFDYLKKSNKNKGSVLIGIEVDDKNNWQGIKENMTRLGFVFQDITDDEQVFDLLV